MYSLDHTGHWTWPRHHELPLFTDDSAPVPPSLIGAWLQPISQFHQKQLPSSPQALLARRRASSLQQFRGDGAHVGARGRREFAVVSRLAWGWASSTTVQVATTFVLV